MKALAQLEADFFRRLNRIVQSLVYAGEAFVQKGSVVIDCPVDHQENLTLVKQHGELGP